MYGCIRWEVQRLSHWATHVAITFNPTHYCVINATIVCDAWSQTAMPDLRLSSQLYVGTELILLADRSTCETTCPGLHSEARRPGFEPASNWSQVQHPNHSDIEPHYLPSEWVAKKIPLRKPLASRGDYLHITLKSVLQYIIIRFLLYL